MTYGRARLWLGISGVGSFVVIASIALAFGLPLRLSNEQTFGSRELLQLFAVIGCYMVWLAPLDFLGGYWLPNRFQKSEAAFGQWLRGYAVAASFQALVFAICGSSIVLLSQSFGVTGGLLAVTLLTAIGWYVRSLLIDSRAMHPDDVKGRLSEVVAILASLIPENGVSSVAGLVSTLCWFTLWSFVGLLILPTVSLGLA